MPPRERSTPAKSGSVSGHRGAADGALQDTPAGRNVEPDTLPPAVVAALAAVAATPGDGGGWDKLEALAAEAGCLLAVADAYQRALHETLPPSVVALVGERAARFHQEWLADWPELLLDVLEQVVAIDASADWAQKRLIVALTLAERWDRLLGVYDRALSVVPERGRRVQLLKEAVQVAKDFVGDADRAIGYLQLLAALEPGDWQVTNALERLLERQGRWAELVTSWRTRLESADGDEARALRMRIAEVQIDKLGLPAPALEEARRLLAEEAGREGLALGERLIALESAPFAVRLEAMRLVEARHDWGGQTRVGAGGRAGRPGLRHRLGARRASSGCRITADRSGRRPRGRRSPGRLARALSPRRRGAGLLAPPVRGHRRRRAVCTRSGGGRRPHLGSAAAGGALARRRRRARALAR